MNLEECFWVWIGNPLGFRVWTSTNSTMVLSQLCRLISSTSLRIHWSTSSEPVSSTESCYGTTVSSKVDIFLLVATLGAQHHHERALDVFLLARMQCHDSTKSEIHANWGSSIVQFLTLELWVVSAPVCYEESVVSSTMWVAFNPSSLRFERRDILLSEENDMAKMTHARAEQWR